MPGPGEAQLRMAYSLLKPAVRLAARFHIPIRALVDLLRLAYFELLSQQGLTQAQIARRFGQTERHMRSLARRLRGDFFAAEQDVGIVREVEDLIAAVSPTESELKRKLRSIPAEQVERVIELLIAEERVVRQQSRLTTSRKYVLLKSEHFSQRIDALNHFLDGAFRATLARLIFDDREQAMIKTISFSATPKDLTAFIHRFEGELRRDIAVLEETAQFAADKDNRYTFGLSLAPLFDDRLERPSDG